MQKTKWIFCAILFLLSGILNTGCSKEKNQVKKTAMVFLEAYYTCQYEKTRPISTYTTQKLVDKKAYYYSLNPQSTPQKKFPGEITDIIFLQAKDKALVRYLYKKSKRQLFLSKSNKGWLVDMDEKHPIELFVGPESQPLSSEQNTGDDGVVTSESDPIRIGDVK
ncbi:MAG: hypothetical protein RRX93_08545 [Bacteroidales bacterium]